MLDMRMFRDHADVIRADHAKRGLTTENIDRVIELDSAWKKARSRSRKARGEGDPDPATRFEDEEAGGFSVADEAGTPRRTDPTRERALERTDPAAETDAAQDMTIRLLKAKRRAQGPDGDIGRPDGDGERGEDG